MEKPKTSFWKSTLSEDTVAFTREDLEKAFELAKNYKPTPHGTEGNPHIANPHRPDFCTICGWTKPK